MSERLNAVTGGGTARLLVVAALVAVAATAVAFGLFRGGDAEPSVSAATADAPASQTAVTAAYIRFNGEQSGLITGSATEQGRTGWSHVISFSESMTQPRDAASGLPTGRIRANEFTVSKPVDRASTALMNSFVTNEPFDEVTVEVLRRTQSGATVVNLRYTLQNAQIIGRRISGSVAGGSTEVLSIHFERMFFEWPENGLSAEYEYEPVPF